MSAGSQRKFSRKNLSLPIPQKITTAAQSPRKSSGQEARGRSARRSWQEQQIVDQDRRFLNQAQFPTRFGALLRNHTAPVPPALLRALPTSHTTQPSSARQKDASEKLKVAVRVCSSKGAEVPSARSPQTPVVSIDARRRQLTLIDPSNGVQNSGIPRTQPPLKHTVPKIFGFDTVFAQDDSLTEICSGTLVDVVQTVISGSDSCLLTFGHASPGKTQTVYGSDQSISGLGLFPSAISWLFRAVEESRQKNSDTRFSVRVSAVEVCGPNEELRDLLAKEGGNEGTGISLKDDPVMGTQVQNVSELRTPTVDVAAHFLDAALASRKSKSSEEQRSSHLFFTLHVYQYKMESGKSGVAGGRTRLHLIDLGSGEKSSKAGRISLTLPALGNVLLTLLQGQKYLPFKDSKLTQMLKEAIASTSCRTVSALACVSSDEEKYFDTLNIVQIAGRLHRIRRQRKTKMGLSSQNSSGGESSCDDKRRRRLPRSASDPDCTTSSSEQSCDTVIYLGDPKGPRYPHSRMDSDRDATTDDNSPPTTISKHRDLTTPTGMPPNPFPGSLPNSLPGSPRTSAGPSLLRGSPLRSSAGSRTTVPSQETWIDGPRAQPSPVHQPLLVNPVKPMPQKVEEPVYHQYHEFHRTESEQWVDGPKAKGSKKGSSSEDKSGLILDPYKREMIQKWVHHQEEQRMAVAEYWVHGSLPAENMKGSGEDSSPPGLPQPHSGYSPSSHESELDGGSSGETKDSSPVEMREICIQCDEADIDLELGLSDAGDQFQWRAPDLEIRFLEDIQEETEDSQTSSDSHSHKSGRSSRSTSVREQSIRNEGLANPMSVPSILMDPVTLGGLEMLGISNPTLPSDPSYSMEDRPAASIYEEHPLRILSREGGMEHARSDSFSINSEHLDSLSLPATDQLDDDDDEIMSDEDLEKAMAASLTSVRSHEILVQLKTEAKWEELRQQARESREQQREKEGNNLKLYQASTLPRDSKQTNPSPKRKPEPPKFEIQSIKRVPPLSTFDLEDENEEMLRLELDQDYEDLADSHRSFDLPPDGSEDLKNYPEAPPPPSKPHHGHPHKMHNLVCCSMTTSSGSSNQSWQSRLKQPSLIAERQAPQESPLVRTDKLHRPTVPSLPASISREITSKIASAVGRHSHRSVSESPRHSGRSQLSTLEHQKGRSPSAESATVPKSAEPSRVATLKTSTRLPSPMTMSTSSGTPKPGWGRRENGSVATGKAKKESQNSSTSGKAAKKAAKSGEKKSASSGTSTIPTSSKATSAIMNFLKSPTRASMRKAVASGYSPPAGAAPAPVSSAQNRASSGYDSGHDSGIVGGSSSASPELQIMSPYRKVTRPRTSQRSSSGHGSDGSSVQSGDLVAGSSTTVVPMSPATRTATGLPEPTGATPKKSQKSGGTSTSGPQTASRFSFFLKGRARNRDSVAASSGYESSGMKGDSSDNDGKDTVVCVKSPDSSSGTSESIKSPPSARVSRKNYFGGSIPVASGSQSAPQSPCGAQKHGKLQLHQSQLVDERAESKRQEEMRSIRRLQRQVTSIKAKQDILKDDLKAAKERLGIPDEKWSFEMHAEECLQMGEPALIEALEQETKILEKRVVACQSHVMMVTSFDASPSRP